MTKDRRLYARFTLDFPDSRKILPLSDAAFRCYVEAVIWSRKEESDGWLARRLALAKWSLEVLQELSTNDPENPSLIESEEGWLIHDYHAQQDTKAEIDARREHAITAGRKGGLAKAKQGAKRPAKRSAKRNGSKGLSKTVAETETYLLTPNGVSGMGESARFARRAHPPKDERLTRETCPRCDADGNFWIRGVALQCGHPTPEEIYPDDR